MGNRGTLHYGVGRRHVGGRGRVRQGDETESAATIVSQAVRWYFRFQLSLRDIEELLFERGVIVNYGTIRRWCEKVGAAFARRVKAARRKPGRIWHLDEMFVYLRGEPWLLLRAVDEHGTELDILLQKQRDKAAAKRFFQRVLRTCSVPRRACQ